MNWTETMFLCGTLSLHHHFSHQISHVQPYFDPVRAAFFAPQQTQNNPGTNRAAV
jgi:hypothetical protein